MRHQLNNPTKMGYLWRIFFLLTFLSGSFVNFAQPDTIKYTGSPTFCQGQSLVLSANPTGSTYQWQLNGVNTVTTANYTATASGTVTVTTNGRLYAPLVVTVNPVPTAGFTASSNGQCGSVPVSFTNTSTGSGLTYAWSFGDPNSGANNTTTVTNPVHRFAGTPGNGNQNLAVVLTTTNSFGCNAVANQNVNIKQNPGTQLGGIGSTTYDGKSFFTACSGNSPEVFTFSNQSSTSNSFYRIIWGDASPDYSAATFSSLITHSYTTGTYTLNFIVTGQNGCVDTAVYSVFVGANPAVGLGNPGNTSICTGSGLTFPINTTSSNPPGTVYTVIFNDGTPSVTYQHPAPPDVTHNFLITSCGTNSPGYNNSFSATVTASNPCNSSTASVVPIYVSKKPVASFSILPRDTACVNTPVTFTNTSGVSNYVSNGNCTNGKIIWKITPVTGWTVSSGSLGNDFGSTDPSIWSSGTSPLIINFNITGSYTISFKTGNPKCGSDSVTKAICINPTPIGAFTIDKNIGCTPVDVVANNGSNTPICGGNTYTWSVSYSGTAGCLPNASNFIYTNGTNASSDNPQFQFINPGTYTISLVTKSSGGACTAPTVSKTVTVKAKPTATITPVAAICLSGSISPTATVNNCYATTTATYLWTFEGGTPATSTATNPTGVQFSTTGIHNITLEVTNECGTTTANATVNVTTPPVANAGPDSTICSGTPIVIGTVSTGFTYAWTPTTGLSSGAVARPTATINYTGPSADSTYRYILKVSAGATCFTQDTVFITVKKKPVLVLNPLAAAVCSGSSTTLTVSGASSYTWTPATGLNQNTGDTVIATPAATTLYTVTGTVNGCPATANITVTVTASPVANAGPDTAVCSGTSVVIGVNVGGAFTYAWTPTTGLSNAGTARPAATLSYTGPLSDTTYQYIVTVSAGASCSSKDTVLVRVKKKPVVTINPASIAICAGTTTKLVANGADNYVWLPANGINTTIGDTVLVTPAGTTTYTVTGTLLNGCPANAVVIVTVISSASVDAGRDSTICKSSTAIQFTGTPAGGSWSGSTFLTAGGLFNPAAAGNGTYKLYYTAGNASCLRTDSLTATVIDAPNVNAGRDTTLCIGGANTQLVASPAGGSWSGSAFVTPAGLFNPSTPGTYTLIYTFGGGSCFGKDTAIVTVTDPVTNNLISANQAICVGNQPALITGQNITGGNGSAVYQWQSSTDSLIWAVVPGATSKDYTPPVASVTIFYRRMASTSGCSITQNFSLPVKITVNPDARAVFNPTKTKGCVPFVITPAIINLTPFNAAVIEYRWYVDGIYIGSGQNFPGTTMNNTADSITIKLVAISRFGCKNDSMQRGFVTVARPVPAFSQSDSVGCGPLTVSFTNNTPNANQYTYAWNFGNGQTSTLQQPGPVNFPTNPLGGDTIYTVSFKTLSECDTILLKRFVRVKSKPKVLFTPDKSVSCSGYDFTFSNTSRGNNATYIWDFGDGTPLLTTNAAQVNHVYRVGVSDTFSVKLKGTNECGTDSLVYKVVVNPITIRLDFAINGNQRFGCAPHLVQFINNSIGGNIYTWDFGDGTTLLTTKGIDTIPHVYTLPGNYTIRLRGTNSCSDTSDIELVTVNLKPAVSFSASPLIACIGDTIKYTNLSDTGTVSNWRFGDGSTSVFTSPAKTFATAGTFRTWLVVSRAYASGNACADSAFKDIVIRDTLPGAFTVSDTASTCIPVTITFKNTIRPSAFTNWNFGDGNTGTGDSVTHTYTAQGVYTVKMASKGATGCFYSASKTINLIGPSGLLRYNQGYVCLGDAMQFEIIATNTTQYRFVFGGGDSVTTANNLISHIYTRPGTFIPYAWLITNGCSVKIFTGDTVKVDRAKAGFKYAAQQVCGATTVVFTDTSNAYFGIRSWLWNFGDGTFSNLQHPSKTFTQSGLYNVRLRITGISGCVDTVLIPVAVAVRTKPVSAITGDTLACIGQVVSFAALVQSQDPISGYDWNFGNGNTGSGINITTIYNTAGTFIVRLISRTSFGCADTVYKTIRVNTSPIVNAGNDVRICLGQSVQLNATGASQWQWSPLQNLSCTTCNNPVASPSFTTVYVATGSNSLLCTGSDSITVEVIRPFTMSVSPSDSICIGQSSQLFASGGFRYSWNPAVGLDRADVPNPISTPLSTTFYRVIGFDQYNCFSDTGFVRVAVGQLPTVDLGTGATVVAGTNINLNAVITGGPIAIYRWTPTRDLSCTNCGNPVATINTDILYKLEVETFYGCTASDTISFKVNCDPSQVFIPNAFSPDGDGINDILMVRAKGIAQVKYFRIFNRWGQLVFERSNFGANDPQQGWDGKIKGAIANP
ncbi:MAG: PKD domain-containing protein, partial [Chitinophagaceae bacterium]